MLPTATDVMWSVGLAVSVYDMRDCLLVMTVIPAKTAEPIKMPLGVLTFGAQGMPCRFPMGSNLEGAIPRGLVLP